MSTAFNVQLPKLQIELDRGWRDSMRNTQFIANVEALRAQLQRQTLTIDPIITGSGKNAKKLVTTLYWPEVCSTETVACTDECVAATGEATDNSQDITLSCMREAGFTESFKRFRTSPHNHERVVAMQMLAKMKALDEYLAAQYITFLEAHKGTHEYELSVGGLVGGDWEISAADWNVDLIPEFMLSARLARFSNPYLLDGINFWTQRAQAGAYQANSDGKGAQTLFGDNSTFAWVVDPENITATAPGKTYMVNSSAVAFVSGNFWDTTPIVHAGQHRMYKVASRNLPGVFYDVHEYETCSGDDFITSYKIKVHGSFNLNPLNCEVPTRTGILAFEKV